MWLYDRGRKSILLGRAKILLSDLVYNDAYGSYKRGPKVKHELDILPNPELLTRLHPRNQPKDIGSLKVVFSLRKSISEMARHYREGKRARDVPHMKDGAGPEIVNISINVEKCEGLNVSYDPQRHTVQNGSELPQQLDQGEKRSGLLPCRGFVRA